MEWAQTGIILSGAAQFHGFPDQVYDVDAGFDIINLGHLVLAERWMQNYEQSPIAL
jgi:hypothetical protein